MQKSCFYPIEREVLLNPTHKPLIPNWTTLHSELDVRRFWIGRDQFRPCFTALSDLRQHDW